MIKVIDAPDISPAPEYYSAAAELRRLQDEVETLRAENNILRNEAEFQAARNASQKEDINHLRLMLDGYLCRPAVGAPLARRLKYLVTGV